MKLADTVAQSGIATYKSVPIIVFGASGFIGRWVARTLCHYGARVFLVVRNVRTAEKELEQYEVNGEYVELDILNFDAVLETMRKIRPWITFNLVAYGVRRNQRDVVTSRLVNTDFVSILAKAVNDTKNDKWPGQNLIHVGSALEYGAAGGNLDERQTLPKPDTVYGISKLAGTKLLGNYCQKTNLKALTARLFSVYGPGEPSARLLPTLIDSIYSEDTIDLTAGLQQRDFIYVEDVADGLLRLGLSDANPGEAVNMATGKLSSVKEFILKAVDLLDIPQERLNFGAIPTRTEEMVHSDVSIKRLQNLTKWSPSNSIENGIRRTLMFFRNCERQSLKNLN